MKKNIIQESGYLDMLKGFVKETTEFPRRGLWDLAVSTSRNNNSLLLGLRDHIKERLYDGPKETILHPKDYYDFLLRYLKNEGYNPSQAHGAAVTIMGRNLARPAVPLAAGAYGVHKALEDDVPIEQVKTGISDTVDDVKDNTLNFVDEHPILAGTAGLAGTALAGGALYNYLKNRNKKNG